MPDMTDPAEEPGELIGRGRAADIYAVDAGRVLRRYRTAHRGEAEAGLMRYLAGPAEAVRLRRLARDVSGRR